MNRHRNSGGFVRRGVGLSQAHDQMRSTRTRTNVGECGQSVPVFFRAVAPCHGARTPRCSWESLANPFRPAARYSRAFRSRGRCLRSSRVGRCDFARRLFHSVVVKVPWLTVSPERPSSRHTFSSRTEVLFGPAPLRCVRSATAATDRRLRSRESVASVSRTTPAIRRPLDPG